MNLLLTKRYITLTPNNSTNELINKIQTSKSFNSVNFCIEIHSILSKYKEYIDEHYEEWDKFKHYMNKYALLNYNSFTQYYKPIALYEPISRAYYKLWEIVYNFKLINKKTNLTYCALAEGPGGFVECFINYRKRYYSEFIDNVFCMTLKKNNKYKNHEWNKIKHFMYKKKTKIKILYGADQTGNLYNIENILYLYNTLPKCDFVTGDGGFDYSINFNKQEQLSYRLLFCEIVSAFCILKKGGHFILKIFDIHTNVTIQMIYLLNCLFKKLHIIKPFTSRPANSEKYVICESFKEITTVNLNILFDMVKKWESVSKENLYICNLFDFKISNSFKVVLSMANYYFTRKQITSILQTLYILNNKKEFYKLRNDYLQKQVIYCLIWCELYDQNINFKSKYLCLIK